MDLSKMLEDLYPDEENRPEGEGTSSEPAGPEWADESRLEEVFSTWTPGPPSDAPDAEREMAEVAGAGIGADRDLRAEIGGELVAASVESGGTDDIPERSWTRSDDDVLVGGRRGTFSLLRR